MTIKKEKAVKYYNEAISLEGRGKLLEAERVYKKAIKFNPGFVEAHNNLGNILLDRGQIRESVNSFRKALQLMPDHPMLMHNLAKALQQQGAVEKSISWYQKAILNNPSFVGNYINLGNALRTLGRFDESLANYRQALEIDPGIADTYNNLGGLLLDMEELEEAIANFKSAIELDGGHIEAYNGLGNALAKHGDIDESIAAYRKAIEISPLHKDAYNGLGNVLSDMGEIDEAILAYRKAIELNPEPADVYRSLAKNKKFTSFDEDIRTMNDLYQSRTASDEQRMHLAFGLGKAYEDLGEYDRSIDLIIEAARLKRASFDYTTADSKQLFDEIKATFTAEFFSAREAMGVVDDTPVFILGMPRSGTSLAEQIMASHPQIFGAGELNDITNLIRKACPTSESTRFPQGVTKLDTDMLANLGEQYIAGIRRLSEDARYITDKMPHNFLYIGFIRTILPRVKIIHCTRDPMDNCLSIFKNFFNSTHFYSYDQVELGEYYTLYLDLMAYWKKLLSDQIYDLSYEALVEDQENEVRKLLDYVELPWDDACLDFHKTRRKVRTASNAQVRKPIYRDSVQLWKRYERQLQPLRSAIYG